MSSRNKSGGKARRTNWWILWPFDTWINLIFSVKLWCAVRGKEKIARKDLMREKHLLNLSRGNESKSITLHSELTWSIYAQCYSFHPWLHLSLFSSSLSLALSLSLSLSLSLALILLVPVFSFPLSLAGRKFPLDFITWSPSVVLLLQVPLFVSSIPSSLP